MVWIRMIVGSIIRVFDESVMSYCDDDSIDVGRERYWVCKCKWIVYGSIDWNV